MNIENVAEIIKEKLDKPIVLVGLMGAGKTTVGKLLAEKLGWAFYDSDDEIVRTSGKSVSAIFDEDGELAFRDLERITIKGLLKNKKCVIASGGGSISIPETANLISENSVCLWLDAQVETLVERVKGSNRPLLKHGDADEILASLLEKRREAYSQAHIHVLNDNMTAEDVTQRILLQLSDYLLQEGDGEMDEERAPQSVCLTVSLFDRSYPIFIGSDLLNDVDVWLPQEYRGKKAFIITDYNVRAAVVETMQAGLVEHMKSISMMELPPGESSKSFDRYQVCLEWLLENGVKRDSIIFAIGGGVVGDLAGFISSTVLRGINFIQIPTTLLSQVDSSVGGKTGINSKHGKNLIGAFYQPKAVVIDINTLNSLPKREWLSGYAEIVKYGLLGDAEFFAWLEKNAESMLERNPANLIRAIEKSCRMKANIVADDEHETNGARATLNLGHTFGHALESLTGYSAELLHGEAVGIGLVLAAQLSKELGYIDEDDVQRIINHLKVVGLRTHISEVKLPVGTTANHIIDAMRKDKKATEEGLGFVVLKYLGSAELMGGISEELVRKVITESL